MLNMPPAEIKAKIVEQTDLSAADVDTRVDEKMKQLSGLVSEEGACHIVANELSVDLIPKAEDRTVKDLTPGMRDIEQDLRVVQVYELRTFESKFGDGQGKVCSFLAGDSSGLIRVTCWGDHADAAVKLKSDDVVRVSNAYVKDNRGRAELHLNDKSTLTVNPEGVTVSAPERKEQSEEYVRKKIKDITRGDYRVELVGTLVQAYQPNFFDRKDGSGRGAVMNIMIDDGTGNMRCALWGENAAKALGIDEKTLLANGEQPYDEERTALIGNMVKLRGRAKLNETYNSIEMNVDVLDLEPDAGEELQNAGGDTSAQEEASASADATPDQREVDEHSVTDVEEGMVEPEENEKAPDAKSAPELKKQPVEDEPISLDELDDLDLDDI